MEPRARRADPSLSSLAMATQTTGCIPLVFRQLVHHHDQPVHRRPRRRELFLGKPNTGTNRDIQHRLDHPDLCAQLHPALRCRRITAPLVPRLRHARRQQKIRPAPVPTQRTDVHLQLTSARQHDMVAGIRRDNLVSARGTGLVEHGKRIRRDPVMGG